MVIEYGGPGFVAEERAGEFGREFEHLIEGANADISLHACGFGEPFMDLNPGGMFIGGDVKGFAQGAWVPKER